MCFYNEKFGFVLIFVCENGFKEEASDPRPHLNVNIVASLLSIGG
jgi:hypothetical protein